MKLLNYPNFFTKIKAIITYIKHFPCLCFVRSTVKFVNFCVRNEMSSNFTEVISSYKVKLKTLKPILRCANRVERSTQDYGCRRGHTLNYNPEEGLIPVPYFNNHTFCFLNVCKSCRLLSCDLSLNKIKHYWRLENRWKKVYISLHKLLANIV